MNSEYFVDNSLKVCYKSFMTTKEETREAILDAAWKRFGHYGYNKTTMAEIAKDCGMSAANLYRYFKDKSAIGAGIARRYFDKESALIAEAAARTDSTPREKLEEIVLVSVRYNFTEFEDSPAIMDLVDHICRDGQHLIEEHRHEVIASVVKVLAEGNASGDFDVENLEETAISFRMATIQFHVTPVFLMFKAFGCCQKEMEGMVRMVVRLIVDGIARR